MCTEHVHGTEQSVQNTCMVQNSLYRTRAWYRTVCTEHVHGTEQSVHFSGITIPVLMNKVIQVKYISRSVLEVATQAHRSDKNYNSTSSPRQYTEVIGQPHGPAAFAREAGLELLEKRKISFF